MFKKVEKENERLIEDYIGDDYNKCLPRIQLSEYITILALEL